MLCGFLTSSLNVELVYVILKGIIESQVRTIDNNNSGPIHQRIDFDKIEIIDFKSWEGVKQQSFLVNENIPVVSHLDEKLLNTVYSCEKLSLNKQVFVIAYHNQSFAKLRAQDCITQKEIKLSLCPTLNRTNVFKAGEASGASGSFFFFSHNK